jgi:putative transposase
MRDFKKYTSGEIRRQIEKDGRYKLLQELRYEKRKQKFKVWQDRFDDLALYSRKILEIKLEYIHHNPVKAGLVDYPTKYIHSSAGFYHDGIKPPIDVLNYYEVM